MDTAAVITVTANACAAIATALLLLGIVMGNKPEGRFGRYFRAMLAFNIAGCRPEFLYSSLEGMPGAGVEALRNGIVLADYLWGCCVYITFSRCMYAFLSTKGPVSKKPFIALACLYILQIPVLIVIGIHTRQRRHRIRGR